MELKGTQMSEQAMIDLFQNAAIIALSVSCFFLARGLWWS
jgi:hypothetical protein